MQVQSNKTDIQGSKAIANTASDLEGGQESQGLKAPERSVDIAQRKLQDIANNSPQVQQLASVQRMADSASQKKENKTGMPDQLKSGIESISGIAMDDVRVHYNSPNPVQMQALAYAQGTDIHIGPGQEKHLAHEAWHVVQQKQGRVAPTMQLKGFAINDNSSLEREADIMGAAAMDAGSLYSRMPSSTASASSGALLGQTAPAQRKISGTPVRQFICGGTGNQPPSLDNVINEGAKSKPSDIANQISGESESFRALRGEADEEVNKTFGKKNGVEYKEKPKTGGGTGPAYYKDGDTFFDKGAPMPATVLNIVFETANAAQAGKFLKVETDFDNGTLMGTPLSDYNVPVDELGDLVHDTETPASKRSLIQEYYEWRSFQIAKNSLVELSAKYKSEVAQITWETSFGAILQCKNFLEYYALSGRVHRSAVQATLEPKKKTEDSSDDGRVDMGKLFS